MLCADCEALAEIEKAPAPAPEPPVSDQLCTRCGHLLGTAATVQKLHRKQSQLEGFGLSGHRRPLTKPKGGGKH